MLWDTRIVNVISDTYLPHGQNRADNIKGHRCKPETRDNRPARFISSSARSLHVSDWERINLVHASDRDVEQETRLSKEHDHEHDANPHLLAQESVCSDRENGL